MTEYTHGVYGELKDAVIAASGDATTAAVAIGTLPVNLVADWSAMVGVPLKMDNASAKDSFGYCSDWSKYTLCEVMQAFFGGASGNVGGLYCINLLDPAKHKAAAKGEQTVAFKRGVGYLSDTDAIVSSIAVEGAEAVTAYYNAASEKIVINASGLSAETAKVTYDKVDPSKVEAQDIVGAVAVLDDLYPMLNAVPNIVIAPGWSDDDSVYDAITDKVQAIDGRFFGFAVADAPTSVKTIDAALEWKVSSGRDSKFSKVCWPCAKDADGAIYHASTLFAREMVKKDAAHGGVPYVTASNTALDLEAVCLPDGAPVKMYQEHGNQLNEYGISTIIAWGGQIRLWGGHTAGYAFGADNEASSIFDTNVRMLCHIINSFILEWGDEIDQPMTKALQETVLFTEQSKLDGLVAMGALTGNPKCSFLASSNPMSDIVEGNFTWDLSATPTPQFKTARAVVAYSTEGFSAYISDGEEA